MAKKKIKATAELFLDTKNAKSDAAKFVNDIRQKLADIETAADKMTVFKDVVKYIGMIDRALGALKEKNADAFNHMFDGLDAGLRKQFEEIFDMSGSQLGQFDVIRDKIKNLTPKSSINDIKSIAKEINGLFSSLGIDAPFNDINSEFFGRTKPEDIERLTGALGEFANIWKDVTRKVGAGFGMGGIGRFGGFSAEIQAEIDALEDSVKKYKSLAGDVKKIIEVVEILDDYDVPNQFGEAASADEVIELLSKYKELKMAIDSTGDKSSIEYYKTLTEYAKVATKLYATSYSNDKKLSQSMKKYEFTDRDLINSIGLSPANFSLGGGKYDLSLILEGLRESVENFFISVDFEDASDAFNQEIKNTMSKIEQVKNDSMKIANTSSHVDSNNKLSASYIQLKEALQSYIDLQQKLDADGSDDGLEKKILKIEKIIHKMDELGENENRIDSILEDLSFGDVGLDQALEQLSDILKIDIISGNENDTSEAIDQVMTKLQEFFVLTREIQSNDFSFDDAEDNVKIGKYIERLTEAKTVLDNLGEQGLLTAEQLGEVALEFDKSKIKLESSIKYYDGYGNGYGDYSYTYAEEFEAATRENERLQHDLEFTEKQYQDVREENERLRQEVVSQKVQQDVGSSVMTDDEIENINRENGALEDKLELLLEISQQYGSQITQKKRDRYEELNQKDMNDGLSSREEERMSDLFDEIVEADEALEEFGNTYESIILKLVNGKKVEILPDDDGLRKLYKFFDGTSGDDYGGVEIDDIIFKRRQEHEIIQQNNQELQEKSSLLNQINNEEQIKAQSIDNDIGEITDLENLLVKVNEVKEAVDLKTQAFREEADVVDSVVLQEIRTLEMLKGKIQEIKDIVNEFTTALNGQWTDNIDALFPKLQQLAQDFTTINETIRSLGADFNLETAEANTETGERQFSVKMDTSDMESALSSAIGAIQGEVTDVISEMGQLKNSVLDLTDVMTKHVKPGEASEFDQKVENTKKNILQFFDMVKKFNMQAGVDDAVNQQEMGAEFFADGSISVNHGENGSVHWNQIAEILLSNLKSKSIMNMHTHPWTLFYDRPSKRSRLLSSDNFSPSRGDIGAFESVADSGTKIASMISGNILHALNLDKISDKYGEFVKHHADIEKEYAENDQYSKFFFRDDSTGKFGLKMQDTMYGNHEMSNIIKQMLVEALERTGFSTKEILSDIYNEYDLTEDNDLTNLATKLVELSSASQAAQSSVDSLVRLLNDYDADTDTDEAKVALDGFKKGEMTVADVWNQLVAKHKVSQNAIDAIYRIDSSKQDSKDIQLLSKISTLLESINSTISVIETNTQKTLNEKLDVDADVLKSVIERGNLYHIQSETKSGLEFNNITEYNVQESFLEAQLAMDRLEREMLMISRETTNSAIDAKKLFDSYMNAVDKNTIASRRLSLFEGEYEKYGITSNSTGETISLSIAENLEDLTQNLAQKVLKYINEVRLNSSKTSVDASPKVKSSTVREYLLDLAINADDNGEYAKSANYDWIREFIVSTVDMTAEQLKSKTVTNPSTGEQYDLDDFLDRIDRIAANYSEDLQIVKDYFNQAFGKKIESTGDAVEPLPVESSNLDVIASNIAGKIDANTQNLDELTNAINTAIGKLDGIGELNPESIATAVKEAIYAKDIQAGYTKINSFEDVFETIKDLLYLGDGNSLDAYQNRFTGELFESLEEATAEFEQNFKGAFFSKDGTHSFNNIDNLLAHIVDAQNMEPSYQNDWATVIVNAINTQGSRIEEAIRVVLPQSISEPIASGKGVDEQELVDAFQHISREISTWTSMTGKTPKAFFKELLKPTHNGHLFDPNFVDLSTLSDTTLKAFKTLGMMSESGEFTFKLADKGIRNTGVAIGDEHVLPTRHREQDQAEELIPLLKQATDLGAAVPRIISSFSDSNQVFELQTKMFGENIASSRDFLRATDEQIDKLIHTLEVLSKVGLFPDFIGDNILFDEQKGFSLVDLETTNISYGRDLDSAQGMKEWLLEYIDGIVPHDLADKFRQRVNERMALPEETRALKFQNANQSASVVPQLLSKISSTLDEINSNVKSISGDSELRSQDLDGVYLEDATYGKKEKDTSLRYKSKKVLEELESEAVWERDVEGNDELADVWDYLRGIVKGTTESYFTRGNYQEVINQMSGEIQSFDEIFKIIALFESEWNKDLGFVKDYLSEVFSQFDLSGYFSLHNERESVTKKLVDMEFEELLKGSVNPDKVIDISAMRGRVVGTESKHFERESYGEVINQANGQIESFDDIFASIDKFEQEFGEDLQFVRDYFNKVFAEFKTEPDNYLDQQVDDDTSELNAANIQEETNALEKLLLVLQQVEEAVQNKTQAFVEEGKTVSSVVGEEIELLERFSELISSIATDIGVVVQGFDQINSEISNHKENGNAVDDTVKELTHIDDVAPTDLNYALNDTVLSTNDILNNILAKLGDGSSFSELVEPLKAAVTELKNVSNGIIEEHKRKAVDTRDADARLADPQTVENIKKTALDAVRGNVIEGGTMDVTDMSAMVDGTVKVSGYVQTATDKWEGFTLQVNKAGEASKIAYSVNAKAAKEAAKAAKIAEEAAKETAKASDESKEAGPKDPFAQSLSSAKSSFNEYRKSLQDVDYLTAEVKDNLDELAIGLSSISNASELDVWKDEFKNVQKQIAISKSAFQHTNLGTIKSEQTKLDSGFNKLTHEQQKELKGDYDQVIKTLEEYKASVRDGKQIELDAIHATTSALREKIKTHLEANKAAEDAKKETKKNAKFGSTVAINATAKHNSLLSKASDNEFNGSKVIDGAVQEYNAAYERLMAKINELAGASDEEIEQEAANFEQLKTECNDAAKALNKLINDSKKMNSQFVNPESYFLGEDFSDTAEGRRAALTDFVQQVYGINVAAENFRDNWNKVIFAVDNGDGTFTDMTATINTARNQIGAFAGDIHKVTGKFEAFWNEIKGKFRSVGTYLISSFSIHEVWQQVRKGIGYIQEIDSALTELKKVTDATDESYDRFLDNMSKTAGVVGSTISELTTMASEWARLNI